MYVKLFFGAFILFFALRSHSATFVPIKISDQVRDSDLVIDGKVIGKTFKKIPSGEVVTEYTFQLDKIVGIQHSKIVNKNNFKVIVPGGKWQGVTYKVTGVPKFETGSKNIVLLRKGKFGYYLTNLALSSFQKSKIKNDKTIISEIFPLRKNVGRIGTEYFDEVLQNKWGTPLVNIEEDKFVQHPTFKPVGKNGRDVSKRAPASVAEKKADNSKSVWPIIFLILSGLVAGILRRKKT